MRVLICDDDPAVPEKLISLLGEYFQEKALPQPDCHAYLSGDKLLEDWDRPREPRPDIAFLDVEMPGTSGIEAGARLQARYPFMKIFILTSYPDYLDDAMRFNVFRYLSKPVDRARLFRNLSDAIRRLATETLPVVIETAGGLSLTRYAHEIIMAEAQGRRVDIHTLEGSYASIQGMKYWQRLLLAGGFFHTHRSYIVNMRYVSAISPAAITLRSPKGDQYAACLARRRSQAFKDAYLMYMEAMG